MSLLGPQLEAFMAIVQCKTVHGAADRIHITQTAVTQRIRALETKLRTTLFIRTRQGMKPTQEGEALIRYCQSAQLLEGQALANIQGAAIKSDITLTISGPSSLMRSRLVPACTSVLKKFPQLHIHFDIDDEEENRPHKLKLGNADLAIVKPEYLAQEMKYKKLKPEQYILVAPYMWKNRKTKEIIANESIIDFSSSDQTTFNYLKQYDLFQYAKHARHFANRTEILASMVCDGLGYTTLVKEFAEAYFVNHRIIVLNQGKISQYDYLLAWYHRPEPPAYFTDLLKAMK